MARQLRIDKINLTATDISITYTAGESPLPPEPSGNAFSFKNRSEVGAAIRELQDRLTDLDLLLIRLASIAKNEPSLTNIKTLAEGKTITLDLIGASAVINQT